MVNTPPGPPDRPEELDDPTGIRALLSGLPDPGPMPPDLVARITASIAAEQSARGTATVIPLRSRPPLWRRAGLIAAAAAVVAIGLPALMTGTGPGDVVAFLSGSDQGTAAGSSAASGARAEAQPSGSAGDRATAPVGAYDLTASGTAYRSATLAQQARTMVLQARPQASVPSKAMAASRGPADGPAGLAACLRALGAEPSAPVTADVGTFDGRPAVVAVVSTDTGQFAYAVPPGCDAAHPSAYAGPVPLG